MKIPPFYAQTATQFKTTDFGTEAGCKVLCRIITSAWRNAGHLHVTAEPQRVNVRSPKGGDCVRYGVATNLINGMPPAKGGI